MRHTCVGDVGSIADVVGKRFRADVPAAPGRSVEGGAVVSGAGAGVSALPTSVPSAGSAVVCGVALKEAAGWAVVAVFG